MDGQEIGVHDYASMLQCLTENFQEAFPDYGPTDPQNMIQLMAATVVDQRRKLAGETEEDHETRM